MIFDVNQIKWGPSPFTQSHDRCDHNLWWIYVCITPPQGRPPFLTPVRSHRWKYEVICLFIDAMQEKKCCSIWWIWFEVNHIYIMDGKPKSLATSYSHCLDVSCHLLVPHKRVYNYYLLTYYLWSTKTCVGIVIWPNCVETTNWLSELPSHSLLNSPIQCRCPCYVIYNNTLSNLGSFVHHEERKRKNFTNGTTFHQFDFVQANFNASFPLSQINHIKWPHSCDWLLFHLSHQINNKQKKIFWYTKRVKDKKRRCVIGVWGLIQASKWYW